MWIYNSAHRRKEEFKPLQEGKVGIYACGPTVYNYFHIGNARPFITFDVLRRQLEREGYDVTFVQNFTDIDDKMIKRANEEGITVKELGEKFIAEYYKDAKALGIRPATVHPKATEHIPEIIALVQKLIDGGHAYATPAGAVYYRVESFPGYGKLSGQSVEDREMGASERLDVETDKENPADFALWKSQKPGEPAWESPWVSPTYTGCFRPLRRTMSLLFSPLERPVAPKHSMSLKYFSRPMDRKKHWIYPSSQLLTMNKGNLRLRACKVSSTWG